jgi:hypothetical protein
LSARVFAEVTPARALLSLRTATGALAVLGLLHAEAEWSPRLELDAVGREGMRASTPHGLWSLAVIAAFGVMSGRAPRASAGVFCASLAGLHALAPQVYHNNYYVLWLFVAITALEPTRARSPWGAEASETVAALAPRLVQAQIGLIYLLSVIAKLAHPWWREGGAVVRWIVTERVPQSGLRGLVNPALAPWLSAPAMAAAAQTAILGVETLLPLMLFSPRWRRTAFVVGGCMHVLMQEWLFPQLFTFLMLLGYHAFAPAEDRAWTLRVDTTAHPGVARWVRALDWRGRVGIEPTPGGVLTLVTPEGVTRTGISAGWWLAVLTPASVVAYAALALVAPGVTSLGGAPRAMMENLVVMVVGGVGLIPGKGPSHHLPREIGDGTSPSHPGGPVTPR